MSAFPYSFGVIEAESCADCGLPVPFECVDGVPEPVNAVRDGGDVVHDGCYDARAPHDDAVGAI